jgi:hypothetical protein
MRFSAPLNACFCVMAARTDTVGGATRANRLHQTSGSCDVADPERADQQREASTLKAPNRFVTYLNRGSSRAVAEVKKLDFNPQT